MSNPKSRTVRVAVVGSGHWGKNLIRNFNLLGNLACICDTRDSALAPFQSQYPNITLTTEFTQVLTNPNIDGVVLATPSQTHYPLARQAFEAGKHVYVEKPMATCVEEAESLIALSQASEKILMVGHLLLYHPALNRLKQLIRDDELGQIRYIQSDRLNFNPNRPDKSVLWDLAPHDISLMNFVLDSLPQGIAHAEGFQSGADQRTDIIRLTLNYPNGIQGVIENSWMSPCKQVRLTVIGSDKIALLDDTLANDKLQLFRYDGSALQVEAQPEYLSIEPLKLECQHFINCIQAGKTPMTDGDNGLEVVRLLEACDRWIHP